MKKLTLFVFLLLTAAGAFCQNLIGYSDQEIKKHMKENHKEMNFNNVTNTGFKYLKYSDNSDSQTLLFFLDKDLVCNSVRLICDNSIKEKKVKEFNSIYKNNGENRWIDNHDGKNYIIEVKDERWSCVISIVPDK